MTTKSPQKANINGSTVLKPSYRLPIIIFIFGLSLLVIPVFNPWPSVLTCSFGLFLLIQTFTLRLEFTKTDLVVLQLGKELRKFPYENWLSWRLLLPWLPGLFYFREKASPHLLPIIFDPKMLETQLKLKVGNLETP